MIIRIAPLIPTGTYKSNTNTVSFGNFAHADPTMMNMEK
jgi:hypothetical protein